MFFINLDLNAITELGEQLQSRAERAAKKATEGLTMATHGHLVELAQSRLRSSRETYLEALSFESVSDDTWVITLNPNAVFIESGKPSGEMIDDLLNDAPKPWKKKKLQGEPSGKTKTSRDGSRYRVIPFDQGKPQTRQTPAATSLSEAVKAEMTKRKIPLAKIEKHDNGEPKLGLLHSFDIKNKPLKTGNGPGQGHGPVGQPRQGPTGIPFLQGVRVYQRKVREKNGQEAVKRAVLTFRVVSSKMKGSGRWVHPGVPPANLFQDAYEWALDLWTKKIGPELIEEIGQDRE